jgi:hypothetical protein
LPLGGAFTRYLSDEILALLRDTVNNSFAESFSSPRLLAIPRREITFRGKIVIAKIAARAAEFGAKKFQFSRERFFPRDLCRRRIALRLPKAAK